MSKLYSKIVKHRIQEQWPTKSSCVLLFGPSDLNKTRKESYLLNCDIDVNLALKTAKDLIQRSQEARNSNSGLIYCSVLQVYQDEVTDLMQLPTPSSRFDKGASKKCPYFNEHS